MSKQPLKYYKTVITNENGQQHGRSVEISKEEWDKNQQEYKKASLQNLDSASNYLMNKGIGISLIVIGIITLPILIGIVFIIIGIHFLNKRA